jgi:hypothetical protein
MTSRGKKILLGVLAVFGALAILVVVAVVSFVVWISTPGELIDPEQLVSTDATGYAEWTLRAEDPGTEGFLTLLSDAARGFTREVDSPIPGFSGSWSEGNVTDVLPAVVAWTLHPAGAPGAEGRHVFSVSAERLGNQIVFADWIAGFAVSRSRDPNVSAESYNGETIYRLRQPARDVDLTLFVRRGAVFVASDLDAARQAVDRLSGSSAAPAADGAVTRPATGLAELFARTSPDDALRAAVTNGSGELARLWETVSSEPVAMPEAWRGIEGASLGGGLRADGSFDGTLRLRVADPAAAAAYVPVIPTVVGLNLGTFETRVEISSMAVDDGVQISFTIPDLVEGLAARLQGPNRSREPR